MILPFEVEDAEGGSKRDVLLGGVVGDLQDQTLPRQDVVLLAEASRPTTWGVDSGHNEDVLKFFRDIRGEVVRIHSRGSGETDSCSSVAENAAESLPQERPDSGNARSGGCSIMWRKQRQRTSDCKDTSRSAFCVLEAANSSVANWDPIRLVSGASISSVAVM